MHQKEKEVKHHANAKNDGIYGINNNMGGGRVWDTGATQEDLYVTR